MQFDADEELNTYAVADFERDDEFDQKFLKVLKGDQLPFPVKKLMYDEILGGNYYSFGSKILLLRVDPSGKFIVEVHGTGE